jgi:hypothetical protein
MSTAGVTAGDRLLRADGCKPAPLKRIVSGNFRFGLIFLRGYPGKAILHLRD